MATRAEVRGLLLKSILTMRRKKKNNGDREKVWKARLRGVRSRFSVYGC